MKTLELLGRATESAEYESAIKVYWEERDIPQGSHSLAILLPEMLVKIRTEHMRWAYEMGELDLEEGLNLQKLYEQGEKPSMWWLSLVYERHPNLSPHLYNIYKLRCLEIFMAEHQCERLVARGLTTDITRILKAMCKNRNWGFEASGKKRRKYRFTFKALYMSIPAPIRAVLRYFWWWVSIRKKLKPVGNGPENFPPSKNTATMVAYFPNIDLKAAGEGRFRSLYWENLHPVLEKEAQFSGRQFIRWLFIRFPSPALSFKQCLKLRDTFRKKSRDGISFNYLEEFLESGDLFSAIGRWAKLLKASMRFGRKIRENCHFKNSGLNFWPLIKAEWAESFRGWRCLERCIQEKAFRKYVEKAGNQRWILFPLENCPWERMFTKAWHDAGNQVFGAQHSIVRQTDFRYFDDPRTFTNDECASFQPDIIGGNGNNAISQWLLNGMPAQRVRELSALRYLYLSENDTGNSENELPPDPGSPVEMLSKKNLLVLTGFFEEETSAHLGLLIRALEEGVLDGWQITIKPHPCLGIEKWLKKITPPNKRQVEINSSPLAILLKKGFYIWTSNSTTAALEAAIKKLPLMVMLPVNNFDLCPIQNVPGLMRTATVEDVKNCLANPLPPNLPKGYLNLDRSLENWCKLLGFNQCR